MSQPGRVGAGRSVHETGAGLYFGRNFHHLLHCLLDFGGIDRFLRTGSNGDFLSWRFFPGGSSMVGQLISLILRCRTRLFVKKDGCGTKFIHLLCGPVKVFMVWITGYVVNRVYIIGF